MTNKGKVLFGKRKKCVSLQEVELQNLRKKSGVVVEGFVVIDV